ncbi:ZIP-like zinc transporter [Hamiltosporidium tvaerminnensis]|uniref:ZIP-like zinc transporter n=3 Tax=Hamiltosporidium TaxID=1176354 RepID=A0A4Q9L5F9_9MICR|nr:ZIP-like zinc transporter [Hamiltosporidium tvaerminnensis]TBU02375.1 ZIP-like zinc transporter [Hamiltosporidium magnivora]TBU07996.1 ZIP-like zinc transporter [Hamiltosporidium magnivora]TBU17008.1 ZIP-like zinc transporter [Hamiltosporidium tvaerminnensis]
MFDGSQTEIFLLSVFLFIFTFLFACSYKVFSKTKLSSYTKCLAGGVILSTMIFHIFPDLYEEPNSCLAPLFSGISFLILFSIDKLYLNATQHDHDSLPENVTQAQALIFVIALSLHSFLEGLGIPAKTGQALKWYITGLIGHKWVEAFALGVSIMTAPFPKKVIMSLIVIYSALTPIGTLLGFYVIEKVKNTSSFMDVKLIMTGISSGSFFYIGFIEMLNSEFHFHSNSKNKIRRINMNKICAIFSGFCFMTIVVYVCSLIESGKISFL